MLDSQNNQYILIVILHCQQQSTPQGIVYMGECDLHWIFIKIDLQLCVFVANMLQQ